MSNNISNSILKKFILDKVGNQLSKREAQELNIKNTYNKVIEDIDENNIDIDDIMKSSLYEDFATLYVTEQEKKQEAKDKETEKEEQNQIKDKNKAGV